LNSATSSTDNFMSMLAVEGAMEAANDVLTADGYALRVAGNPGATWNGGGAILPPNRDNLGTGVNWSGSLVPTDLYVLFDADQSSGYLSPVVNIDVDFRGLYFRETVAGSDGFTFTGPGTLTIGRGGLTNYDADRQTFTASILLGDHQYWDVGMGGVTAGDVNTNGHLLEIAGDGTARITGDISGSGGVALSGARLELSETSSFTGQTWVHAGRLVVDGDISASAGIVLAATGELSGEGLVSVVSGAGSINPGASPGILTAEAVDPSEGLDFNFEFSQIGSPDYGNAGSSGNDVLRLTDNTPFVNALGEENVVQVYLDFNPSLNDVLRGGFYTDTSSDFLVSIVSASFEYLVADAGGSVIYEGNAYSLYSGSFTFDLETVPEPADFGFGTINGWVTQWTAIPEPSNWLLSFGVGVAVFLRRSPKRFVVRNH